MQMLVTVLVAAGASMGPDAVTREVHRLWATGAYTNVQVEQAGPDLVFRAVPKQRKYLRRVEFDPPNEKRGLRIAPGTPIDAVAATRIAAEVRRQLVAEGHPEARVDADLPTVGPQQVDLRLRVRPGPRQVVRAVRFSGDPAVDPRELRRELKALRVRRIVPGLWTSRPPMSEEAAESDTARIRSFYLSRGYLDADVSLERGAPSGEVTIHAEAGPRYRIRRAESLSVAAGEFHPGSICSCLLAARRSAEKEGRLDFDVDLRAVDAGAQTVDLTAALDPGPVYRVGRIEFRGNRSFCDATVRRALTLNEGDVLDASKLRRSIARVNRLGFFEQAGGENVAVVRDPQSGRADLFVALKQRRPGGWSFSGPLGPTSFAGPLQASIATRLPGWGRGLLEASTYSLSLSVAGSAGRLGLLPFGPRRPFVPVIGLARPYLPGQAWLSGFTLAPQLGLKGMAASYAIGHLRGALGTAGFAAPELTVPFSHASRASGALLCDAPQPRLHRLRTASAFAVDFLLSTRLL